MKGIEVLLLFLVTNLTVMRCGLVVCRLAFVAAIPHGLPNPLADPAALNLLPALRR